MFIGVYIYNYCRYLIMEYIKCIIFLILLFVGILLICVGLFGCMDVEVINVIE